MPPRQHVRDLEAVIEYQRNLVRAHAGDAEFLAIEERVLLGLLATVEMMRSQNLLILARSTGNNSTRN